MRAIVLAGGFGTRLREKVPNLPKPMAPVAGRPFIEYVLDRLISGGVSEIILSVGYMADIIKSHFGNFYKNIPVSYAVEDEPLGTGGAIVHAVAGKDSDPVLVLNGDTYLDIDYAELVRWYGQTSGKSAMVLKKVPDVSRYGSVQVSDDQVVGFLEKGKAGAGLINAGVYIIRPEVFETYGLSGKFSFESDFLQKYCLDLSPDAYITNAYFIDIGIPEDYESAREKFGTMSRT